MASRVHLLNRFAVIAGLLGAALAAPRAYADGVSAARLALDSAEQRLAYTTGDVNDAQRQMSQAVADQQAAIDHVRSAQSSYDSLRSILDDPNIVQQAQDDLAGAAKLADEKAAAVAASQKRLDQIKAAATQVRTDARRVYESSPAFANTTRALNDAKSRLDAAIAAADAALQNDPQYRALRAEADRLNQVAQPLRDQRDADPQQLAAASQLWIDAAGRAGTYRQNFIDSNRAVVDARAALRAAQQARDALEARFQNDLATDPTLLAIDKDRATEEQNLAKLTDEAQRAQQARAASQQRAQDLQARLLAAQRDFDTVNAELAAAQNDLSYTSNSVNNADQRLRWAADVQNQAIYQRDAAARDLRLAIEDSRREQMARDQLIRDRQRSESDREAAQRQADAYAKQREEEFNRLRGSAPPVAEPRRDQQPRPPRDRTPFEEDQQNRAAAERQAAEARQTAEQRSREAQQREQAAAQQRSAQQSDLDAAARRTAQQAADRETELRRQADAADKERQQAQKTRDEAQQRAAETQQKAAAEQQRQQQEAQRQQQEAEKQRAETQRQADARQREMEAQAKSEADRNQREADARQREMEAQSRQQQNQTDRSPRSTR
jgi:hypothetical protein